MSDNDWNSHRDSSRVNWGCKGQPTLDQIKLGALLRIADAVEKMATSYTDLINENDYWKNRAKERLRDLDRAERQNRALRGVITRMKRKPV